MDVYLEFFFILLYTATSSNLKFWARSWIWHTFLKDKKCDIHTIFKTWKVIVKWSNVYEKIIIIIIMSLVLL